MIKLSDEAKKAYAKYVGPDGRLIIDPSLPDNVKEAFEYFNNEGINILEMEIPDPVIEEEDEPEETDLSEEDDSLFEDEEIEFVDEEDIEEPPADEPITAETQESLNELNNLF